MIRVIKLAVLSALVVVFASSAIFNRHLVLMNVAGQIADTTGTIYTFESLPVQHTSIACRLTAINNSGTTPTLAAKVQTCATPLAADCEDLCVFDGRTTETSGGQTIWQSGDYGAFTYFRAVTDLGGTDPDYDVKIELWYE